MPMTRITSEIQSALPGKSVSITNASSPEVAIIIATSAPKLIIPWENSDTEAKPPMQPGIQPNRAETTICPNLEPCSLAKKRPPDEMFRLSIISIISTTIPVMSTAARRASIKMSSTSISLTLTL